MIRIWQVNVDGVTDTNECDTVYANLDPNNEVSITDPAQHTIGPKGMGDNEEDLEDEALRLLINPQADNPLKHKLEIKKN
jgi:hypothetical protein